MNIQGSGFRLGMHRKEVGKLLGLIFFTSLDKNHFSLRCTLAHKGTAFDCKKMPQSSVEHVFI